jgi:L-iditol 2-dehydrogenase
VKAGVLTGIDEIRLQDVADPALHSGDLLLKVRAATICGTDIRILRGRKTAGIRYPSILGHEFAGEIVDTGGHRQYRLGQAVCVCPQFTCGQCEYCRDDAENLCRNMVAMGYAIDGAFAEYVRIPALGIGTGNVFAMPDALSFEAAALAEPLACVMHGQERAHVGTGDVVVILGAGPIGILHIMLARHRGAKRIIVSQRSAFRREVALQAGADLVLDPATDDVVARVRAETGGLGADVAICAIGVPSLANEALRMVRKRGRVNLFAGYPSGTSAELDINLIHYDEIVVTGAFGLTRRLFGQALALLSNPRFETKPLVTHRFSLSSIVDAFETAESGKAVKVAIVAPSSA